MEEVRYPIKYAILGLEEQVGWVPCGYESERENNICGYIVSKVYLVGEQVVYHSNGTSDKSYQVVFPYPQFMNMEREFPKYDGNFQCHNCVSVSEVFTDFEAAKNNAIQRNSELRRRYSLPSSIGVFGWQARMIERQNEFDERLAKYMEFEECLLRKTEDMVIQDEAVLVTLKKQRIPNC